MHKTHHLVLLDLWSGTLTVKMTKITTITSCTFTDKQNWPDWETTVDSEWHQGTKAGLVWALMARLTPVSLDSSCNLQSPNQKQSPSADRTKEIKKLFTSVIRFNWYMFLNADADIFPKLKPLPTTAKRAFWPDIRALSTAVWGKPLPSVTFPPAYPEPCRQDSTNMDVWFIYIWTEAAKTIFSTDPKFENCHAKKLYSVFSPNDVLNKTVKV